MATIRILVVEDSLTVRKHLCEVLAADREFLHLRPGRVAVFFEQIGEFFEVQHGGLDRKSGIVNRK